MKAPADQPNLLIIMADQLSGTLFQHGPAAALVAPRLGELFAGGVNFNNAYTSSPLCTPARGAFISGQLPSRSGIYDNAAEFPTSLPSYAHYLRRLGYQTTLCGKMHFVGPDQLHGFEQRLTTDIYPADFGWTPDWSRPGERVDWWYHNLSSVTEAGVAEISNQLEFDDEVAYHARRQLYDYARGQDSRPFCLTVSFTHPHDPYLTRRRYWDLYRDDELPMPSVAAIPYPQQDPHAQRLYEVSDWRRFQISDAQIRRARRAYFGNISYLDERIGELIDTLRDCQLADDTIIVVCADHGDMLGERGLWYKMCFYEAAARVPLLLYAPGRFAPAEVNEPVGLHDVLPTLLELGGGGQDDLAAEIDGSSLLALAHGERQPQRRLLMEYAAEGALAPLVAVREQAYKLVVCETDPPQLFKLDDDPHEQHNLADDATQVSVAARQRLQAVVDERWNLANFNAQVRQSQARRRLTHQALSLGEHTAWDYQPLQPADQRYMRNHLDLNELEATARFPKTSSRTHD